MKKIGITLLLAVSMCLYGILANAQEDTANNVIVSENEECKDAFYQEHKDICKADGRNYRTEKETKVHRYPNRKSTETMEKGATLQIMYTCTWDDTDWGWIAYASSATGELLKHHSGWVKMQELTHLYDMASFYYDHQKDFTSLDKLKSQDRELSEVLKEKAESEVVVWSYPYSGEILGTMDAGEYYPDKHTEEEIVYKDEDGDYWLMKSMGVGQQMGAVSLLEPSERKIEAKKTEPYTVPNWTQKEEANIWKYVGAVFAIVVIAGVGIGVCCKKKCTCN